MRLHKLTFALLLSFGLFTSVGNAASVKDYPEIDAYVGGVANTPKSVSAWQYTPDGTSYMTVSTDGKRIVKHDIRTGNELETLFDITHTRETTISDFQGYTLSPDGSKIMVWRDKKMIYRRSFDAEYYVYEIRSRLLKPLSTEHSRQQSPIFSPDGRMVAFVADNNIYIKKLDYGSEVAVTKDGEKNKVINGVPDWTYEEEFTTSCSMTWAPDNMTLCYLKYNESEVPTFTFPLYEGSCEKMSQYALYPGQFTYKYPVAGEKNSVVTLHSYDVETRKIKNITFKDQNIEYIPRITYGPTADKLMVTTLNRDQNRMEIYSVNPKSAVVKSILKESWSAWLNPITYEDIHFLNDFFVVNSCRSGYQHLYVYNYSGVMQRQITSGEYDVTDYYGYNAKTACHFYASTATGAINRIISKVDAKGRITHLTPEQGFASASAWSPLKDYCIINYSNATTAPKYTLCATLKGKTERTLEDNAKYQARWADAPKAEFFTMQTDGGLNLNGYIIKPTNFDASKRYPVIMSQYSGPNSQEVLNRWRIGAENYFAKAGYVVVCVDGRGTGGRGRAFCDVVYKRLGHYESIDQIAAANYAASLPYVDPERIAIYGWSYGGYEAIMAASQQNAPYAAAIAVAPVTDWRYYDTVYAERYMLTPQQNAKGYELSSTLPLIKDRKCPLLIMHGTADDNVHIFNTVQYAGSAQEVGCWADILMFPNKNHSIYGCNARSLVYARLLNYLKTHMK